VIPADPPPPGTVARTVAANSGWRLVAFIAKATGGIVAAALLARTDDGPVALGVYQLGLTVATIMAFAVALGLPNLLVREVARRPDESRAWAEGTCCTTLVSGVLITGLLAVATILLPIGDTQGQVLIIAGAALAFDATSQVLFALFWAWQRMRFEALSICLQEAAFVVGTVIVLRHDGGPVAVMVVYFVTRVLGALTGWAMASWILRAPIVPRFRPGFMRPILRATIPFAADDVLSATYIRADAVLLGILKGPAAVGLYQACTNLVLYMNVLPRMLNSALFAPLSKAWPAQPELFRRLRDSSLRLLGALGVPIMVGSLLLAPRILTFVYGSEFAQAAPAYRILALVIPLRMLGHTLGTSLTSANGQTRRTVAVAAAAATNVALNLAWFIPAMSYIGASWVTVITESGLFIAYAVLLRQIVGPSRTASALLLPAAACVPLVGGILLAWSAPLPVTVAAGAVGFGLGMLGIAYAMAPREARTRPRAVLTSFVKA
jgi:O-antigen/teichoic acid export membrane protein